MNHLKLVINNTEFFLKKDNNFFNKTELKTILDLYAKMVSEGLERLWFKYFKKGSEL